MALIDRGELVRAIAEYYNNGQHSPGFKKGGLSARRLIYQQTPVDAVEIVRCKDCRFWGTEGRCNLLSATKYTLTMEGNAFCCYGEREGEKCDTD